MTVVTPDAEQVLPHALAALALSLASHQFDDPAQLTVLAGLRTWACGYRADEAAVELVAAASEGGWLLDPGRPWVQTCPRRGVWCLDGLVLLEQVVAEPFLEGVTPVLLVASALLIEGPLVNTPPMLQGLPLEWLGPVSEALNYVNAGPRPAPVLDDEALTRWRVMAA